jgi:hypothetical protein
MRIPHLAQRHRIDFVDMPPYQGRKSLIRAALHVFLQQPAVIQFLHSPLNAAAPAKVTIFFLPVCPRWRSCSGIAHRIEA